ncbi:MAG TPA: hypothetical protein VMW52_09950 [Phycisphaerae bacterium]|nr:hypothetical protein [Phycisphaerae bacterium]
MTQQVEGNIKTFTAGEALAIFRRVKFSAGTVVYADQSDSSGYIGITQEAVASGASVAVALKGRGRSYKAVAADSFAVAATLYAADDGMVSDSASGNQIGTALEAATALNDVVEILCDEGSASAPGATTVGLEASGASVPFVVRATVTAAGAEDEVVCASFPRKAEVIDAYMIARDTNAANVTLKNATNAFTGATAKGGTDDTKVQFTNIVEYRGIAAAAAVVATFSAAGSVEVVLVCVPVA